MSQTDGVGVTHTVLEVTSRSSFGFGMSDKVGEEEECHVAKEGGEDVGMPFDGGEGDGGEVFGEGVHGGGCPVEQVGEEAVDGVAPQEEPPKDTCPKEEIDEEGEGKIAEDGEEWNTSEVVSYKWGGEEGADEGDKDDAPEKTDDVVVGWTRREDVLTKKADGGNGYERKLETNIVEIEGIDAQHDEKGECAGVDGHQFAGK